MRLGFGLRLTEPTNGGGVAPTVPANALRTANGEPILTADGEYIIVGNPT